MGRPSRMNDPKDILALMGEWCRATALGFLLRSCAMHMVNAGVSEKVGVSRSEFRVLCESTSSKQQAKCNWLSKAVVVPTQARPNKKKRLRLASEFALWPLNKIACRDRPLWELCGVTGVFQCPRSCNANRQSFRRCERRMKREPQRSPPRHPTFNPTRMQNANDQPYSNHRNASAAPCSSPIAAHLRAHSN